MQGHCTPEKPGAYVDKIFDEMLCSLGKKDEGPCNGDSGSPLTVKKGEKHYLVGVNSWGFGCATVSKDNHSFM